MAGNKWMNRKLNNRIDIYRVENYFMNTEKHLVTNMRHLSVILLD